MYQFDAGVGQSSQTVPHALEQGHIYAIVPRDYGASGAVVEGTFFVNTFPAKILFDSGASHSFISQSFMLRLWLVPGTLDTPLFVATPLGVSTFLDLVSRRCVLAPRFVIQSLMMITTRLASNRGLDLCFSVSG